MKKIGKKIGVFAPSSYIEKNDIETAASFMAQHGFTTFIHPQTYARHNQSAGTSAEKIAALYDLINDDTIDIIWAAGGGNRALHFIDDLDYNAIGAQLNKTPKPIIGFSDVTALLNAITVKTGAPTIHGPVFKNLPHYQDIDALLTLINTDHAPDLTLDNATIINEGETCAPIFGGNLSIFQYLPHTLGDNFAKDAIIMLEDCNEEISRIDRMLLHLKRLGVFEQAAGLIFGDFTNLTDSTRPYGFTLKDIIHEHTHTLQIPIIMDAPFGHGSHLFPIKLGKKYKLISKLGKSTLSEQR